jgi:hypothetical protein
MPRAIILLHSELDEIGAIKNVVNHFNLSVHNGSILLDVLMIVEDTND